MYALVYLMHPGTSCKVFEIFRCRVVGDPREPTVELWLLEADYSVECYTGVHLVFSVLGGICVLLYPIGVPLWFGTYLFRNRKQIRAAPDYNEVAHYKPLFQFYKPDCWLFEVYFMLEKVRASA
jgi:hypothetical protein